MACLAAFSLQAAAAAPGRRVASRRSLTVRAGTAFEMPSEYTKVKPLGTNVLVKVAPTETETAGGIILAESAQRKNTSGDVAEVGPDCELEKGKHVIYNKFGIGTTDIEMNGDSYVIIKEADLIGSFPGSSATANDIPKMTPLGDRILLKADEVSTTTSGGIVLTEGAVDRPCTATVVSVGPGKKGEDGEVKEVAFKPKDRVMFFKYAGDKMYDGEGKEYIVLHESDILATL